MRLALGLTLVLALPAIAPADDLKPVDTRKASIYDAKADARVQVEKATALARRDSRRILVMFGGDWCGWCHKLHALFKSDGEIRGILADDYLLVMVDTKAPNADALLDECKGDLKDVGFPFLAVLGPDGKVITRQKTDPLEEGDHHDPAKVKAFLAANAPTKLQAEAVLADAVGRAKSEGKMVFLHFGAPWCGWCHKLDAFLARPEVAAIVAKDFVEVKIDEDRMIGGKEVDARFRADRSGGIPWFAFLDAEGKALATADGPKGNIGYPVMPDEIDHFMGMLRKVARKIGPTDLDAIESMLKETAKPILEEMNRPRPAPASTAVTPAPTSGR